MQHPECFAEMHQVPNKHWFNFQVGAARIQCISQIYFLQIKYTCGYLHFSVQCAARIVERNWSSSRRMFENLCAEGSYWTVTYIKEIKLYLVICTITSSKKKFQQLYFNWRFGMPFVLNYQPPGWVRSPDLIVVGRLLAGWCRVTLVVQCTFDF